MRTGKMLPRTTRRSGKTVPIIYTAGRIVEGNRVIPAGRINSSNRGSWKTEDLDNPFAEGGFRWVAKGVYTEGERKGQACVCKWFKTGIVFESTFWEEDVKASAKALEIVEAFNKVKAVDKQIRINVPGVWKFLEGSGERTGSRFLCEPFIENYQKFNSSSGWKDESGPWPQVMQALSHFSYHITKGKYVLCDLQGGVYRNFVVLTDPVVLSTTQEFGVTDLGPDGISSFFNEHQCNKYCRSSWALPSHTKRHFTPIPGTTMVPRVVPTMRSRTASTRTYF